MNNFEVIIPIVNLDLLRKLLKSIYENTLKPKRIIMIDNSKRRPDRIFKQVPLGERSNGCFIEVCYSKTGLVNESLNLGREYLSKDCDYVSFLNDDVILLNCFFQRNLEVFEYNKNCGVAVPRTVHTIEEMKKGKFNSQLVRKREGWAMTIRKSLLDTIPPIPCERIATFHGDDWIWYHTVPNSMHWFKDVGNVIYHQVGASIDRLGFKKHKGKERCEFRQIALEKGWTK